MDQSTDAVLVRGSVPSVLWRLAVPGMGCNLAIMAFVLTDLYFVGLLGADALAAMSFTTPINLTLCTVGTGLGLGMLTVIARASGRSDMQRVRALSTHGLLLSVGLMLALSIALALNVRPVFSTLGAEGEVLALVESYMLPCSLSIVLLSIAMVSNGILRGRGDGRTPLVGVVMMAVINTALDPCLMFGLGPFPRLGLAGAAWGTVVAAGAGAAHGLWAQTIRSRTLTFRRLGWTSMLASSRELLGTAMPGILLNACPQLGLAMLTAIAAQAGDASVAAYATGDRILLLLFALPLAISETLVAFVAQNVSAGAIDRVRQGVRYAMGTVLVAWVVVVALSITSAAPIAGLFTHDPAIDAGIREYLWIVPLGYGGMGVAMLAGSVFLATARTGTAMGLVFVRTFVVMVPAAMLGLHVGGPTGLFVAIAASQIVTGLATAMMCRHRVRQLATPAQRRFTTMTPHRPGWRGMDPSAA